MKKNEVAFTAKAQDASSKRELQSQWKSYAASLAKKYHSSW